jgi:hypothetical protein
VVSLDVTQFTYVDSCWCFEQPLRCGGRRVLCPEYGGRSSSETKVYIYRTRLVTGEHIVTIINPENQISQPDDICSYHINRKPSNCFIMNYNSVNYRSISDVAYLSHWLTHGAESFLRSCQLCSHLRTSQRFMEPEGLLPRSQEPSTGPYPEPDRSNPHHFILSLLDLF